MDMTVINIIFAMFLVGVTVWMLIQINQMLKILLIGWNSTLVMVCIILFVLIIQSY